ncbi:MAG: LPS translocon maturation chaperone LptM [Luminiphilus sp.]
MKSVAALLLCVWLTACGQQGPLRPADSDGSATTGS